MAPGWIGLQREVTRKNVTERKSTPVGTATCEKEPATTSDLVRKVERTDALLRRAIGGISRGRTGHAKGAAASEALEGLRPHLDEALGALAQIEEGRDLTEKELAYRRAFRLLCKAKGRQR